MAADAMRIEEACNRAEMVDNTAQALHAAMFCSDSDANGFDWAMMALTEQTHDLKEQLRALTEEFFRRARREK